METPELPGTPRSPAITYSRLPSIDTLSLYHHEDTSSSHSPNLPPEIIGIIMNHLYYSIINPPSLFPNPDPVLELIPASTPYSNPTFIPTSNEQARDTFNKISTLDKTWGELARSLLWRNVSIGMPRAFESILITINQYNQRQHRPTATTAARRREMSEDTVTTPTSHSMSESANQLTRGRALDLDWISTGDSNWSKMGDTIQSPLHLTSHQHELANLKLISTLNPLDSPLLHTKSLSFSRFRTAGLRRSVRQGSHERFVTPHRLLTLLRGTRIGSEVLLYPGSTEDEENSVASSVASDDEGSHDEDEDGKPPRGKLESVGFTEFMDSAISKNVLDELLFRGGYLAEYEEVTQRRPATIDPNLSPESQSALLLSPLPQHQQLYPHPGRTPYLERRSSGEIFLARHLQSSTSRSPSSSSRLASNPEESGESSSSTDDENEDRSVTRPSRRRRDSGATFASNSIQFDIDQSGGNEDRGRIGRHDIAGRGRGISRRNRSVIPPPSSAANPRSSSVPAPFHPQLHRSVSLGPSERSSSVPAARGRSRGAKKIVQILEGSKDVRPIRALDLCGCVSMAFVSALVEAIATYKLGPPGLFPSTTLAEISESIYSSEDSDDGTMNGSIADTTSSRWSTASSHFGRGLGLGGDEDGKSRQLRRIYFPHLRRLGLSSSLLPTPLLTSLVLSFPYLTHLDLSSTLTSPILLKQLAVAGQQGPGGRAMRLSALSLAKCRLATGEAVVGLLCGDCPPFTSMAAMTEDMEDESWGSGEVVMDLIDISLYGDATYPSPLSSAELRLILTVSPAFTMGRLRTIDLSSTPLTDALLEEHFPPQPHLIELGLSNCRGITIKGVAQLLIEKAPGVEVLTLSNSCRPPTVAIVRAPRTAGRSNASTTTDSNILLVMELHIALLGRVATTQPSSHDPVEAQRELSKRRTNLRVVELDDKTLEAVQGGAGDWKVIWGKGRRGWYIDTAITSISNISPSHPYPRTLSHLPRSSPRRQALARCVALNGVVSGEMGWHTRKMEVMRGDGMMGREDGLFSFHAYQV